MGLKFPNNYDITEALDETCLGAVRFGALEEPDRIYDNEAKEYTGEIKEQRANLVFGDPGQPKVARRVKFPPEADLTGFKRRDPVRLIDPHYHLMYIPAQNGNKEYADLVIYAQGLEKVAASTTGPNSKQSQEKGFDQKQPSNDGKEKEKK